MSYAIIESSIKLGAYTTSHYSIITKTSCVTALSSLIYAKATVMTTSENVIASGSVDAIEYKMPLERNMNLKRIVQLKGGAAEILTSRNPFFDKIVDITPVGRSVIFMAVAMSLHFFGYEFARSSSLALFTSSKTGFNGVSAYPLAMACVSPFSFVLLAGYGKQLQKRGPKLAIRVTTLLCALVIALFGVCITSILKLESSVISPQVTVYSLIPKVLVWISFVFQNSYAHLLYTQHWSFIGSVLNRDQGATWFALITGMSSIAATLGATGASRLSKVLGLSGLMFVTSISLLLSASLADRAYILSERHGFEPIVETKYAKGNNVKANAKGEDGVLKNARVLFQRVPVLWALFCEVLSFQSLSMLLNICFVRSLKTSVPDDNHRAAWAAKFYALLNGTSGALQFFALPIIMKTVDAQLVWKVMPLMPLCFTLFLSFQQSPPHLLVSGVFFLAKMMDYSFRGVANEMVYIPLDFESRYLGKEIIGVLANRFGKSGISLFLSILTSLFGDLDMQQLSILTTISSMVWFGNAVKVSNLIPGKDIKLN